MWHTTGKTHIKHVWFYTVIEYCVLRYKPSNDKLHNNSVRHHDPQNFLQDSLFDAAKEHLNVVNIWSALMNVCFSQ